MKDLWKPLFTGSICLLLLAFICLVAYLFRSKSIWVPSVALITISGILFGGYRLILDTMKTSTELKKNGLEIDKLRLEIAEKKAEAEKAEEYVVTASLEEIQIYGKTPRKLRREWVGGGIAIFIFILASLPLIVDRPKVEVRHAEDANNTPVTITTEKPSNPRAVANRVADAVDNALRVPKKTNANPAQLAAAITPPEEDARTICTKGELRINPDGRILYSLAALSDQELRFVLQKGATVLTVPLFTEGAGAFAGFNTIGFPNFGSIEIQNTKGKSVAKCHLPASMMLRGFEPTSPDEYRRARPELK